MDGMTIFALIVLLILIAAIVAIWIVLGMMPGKIARQRNHPQADAINMCGWWGVITMGLLLPVAWIWAYTNPNSNLSRNEPAKSQATSKEEEGQ